MLSSILSSVLAHEASQELGWPGAVMMLGVFAFFGFVIWCITRG